MSTARDDTGTLNRPRTQVLIGLGLLLVGCVAAALLIEGGANVASSIGIVLAVAGLVLLINGVLLLRRGDPRVAAEPDGSFDTVALVALVLAFVAPPVGVVVAAYNPAQHKRGSQLGALAMAIGAILTVIYTFALVLTGALERS